MTALIGFRGTTSLLEHFGVQYKSQFCSPNGREHDIQHTSTSVTHCRPRILQVKFIQLAGAEASIGLGVCSHYKYQTKVQQKRFDIQEIPKNLFIPAIFSSVIIHLTIIYPSLCSQAVCQGLISLDQTGVLLGDELHGCDQLGAG